MTAVHTDGPGPCAACGGERGNHIVVHVQLAKVKHPGGEVDHRIIVNGNPMGPAIDPLSDADVIVPWLTAHLETVLRAEMERAHALQNQMITAMGKANSPGN